MVYDYRDDSGEHDFINANYVDGFREEKKFILAQSPMGTTVESFWKMIYQERCVIVISLISLDKQSCDPYIPLKRTQTIRIGPFAIKNAGTQQIREQYDATILMVYINLLLFHELFTYYIFTVIQ